MVTSTHSSFGLSTSVGRVPEHPTSSPATSSSVASQGSQVLFSGSLENSAAAPAQTALVGVEASSLQVQPQPFTTRRLGFWVRQLLTQGNQLIQAQSPQPRRWQDPQFPVQQFPAEPWRSLQAEAAQSRSRLQASQGRSRQNAHARQLAPSPQSTRTSAEHSRFSPLLINLAYPLGQHCVIPSYFHQLNIYGQEHLPTTGAIILAPTHRSRWDALILALAAGKLVTGRHLRYMVTADEMRGVQGWLIRRLGGFSINVKQPSVTSLRHSVEILESQESLVIFPEGDIYPQGSVQPLRPGLARIALQAAKKTGGIKIVPIHLHYDYQHGWRNRTASVYIGKSLPLDHYRSLGSTKLQSENLTADLYQALDTLSQTANCDLLPPATPLALDGVAEYAEIMPGQA